jgi:acyl-[acyl-carrier-protein]-phospholipid O-acyltransferase/long-chain-fatty-acid--[acyl-carrier-protein] ligase
VPFVLFSGWAGTLADRISKTRLVRVLKVIELVLYVGAGIALLSQHLYTMLIALFLLGSLASFFGPVKYAILPELLKRNELLTATAYVEGGTYVSILLGTLLGAVLVMLPAGPWLVAGVMGIMGALGVACAWAVPLTAPAHPELPLRYNLFASIWQMLKVAAVNRRILAAIIGISWFWSIGAMYLTQLPVFAKEVVGANERVVSLYMGVFTISIALGSLACPALSRRLRAGLLAPLALLGVFLAGADLCHTGYGMAAPVGDALIGLHNYFDSVAHLRILADLTFMAFCGGLFIVPLYTLLQTDAGEAERARIIASNNVVNALFIASASLISAVMYGLGMEVRGVLLCFAALNLPVVAYLYYTGRRRR